MTGASYLPLALLFLASVLPSEAQSSSPAGATAEGATGVRVVEVVEVGAGARLELECGVAAERGGGGWRAAAGALPAGLRASERAGPRGPLAVLSAARAAPSHQGRYVCGDTHPHTIELRVLPNTLDTEVPATGAVGAVGATGAGAATGAALVHGEEGATDIWYEVRGPITVTCPLQGDPTWSINGTSLDQLPESQRKRWSSNNGSSLFLKHSSEDDFGNYSCELNGDRRAFFVRAKPRARVPENVNVVEQQGLRVTCRLIGKPYVPVGWFYANESAESNTTWPVQQVYGERVSVEASAAGVPGGVLVLREAERADAGWLHCVPLDAASGLPPVPLLPALDPSVSTTELRVKDKYAALWPFLGICAEVLVLCAVILLYERRRTKPELDDSDTDNHDQKKS